MLGLFTLGGSSLRKETTNYIEIFHYFSHVKGKVLKQLDNFKWLKEEHLHTAHKTIVKLTDAGCCGV